MTDEKIAKSRAELDAEIAAAKGKRISNPATKDSEIAALEAEIAAIKT